MSLAFSAERVQALIDILRPERRTRVLDIGANPLSPGPYADLLAAGHCDVWGFEPQDGPFAELVAAAGPREHYIKAAVGDGTEGRLRLCHGSGYSSLLEPDAATIAAMGRFGRGMRIVDTVPLRTQRLDDIAEVPEFDLLKIDVQGSELAVFENGRTALGRAVAVITEVAAIPLYKDQPLLDAQMRTLGTMGYHLHRFMFLKTVKPGGAALQRLPRRSYASQLIDADAVFVRGLLAMEGLGDESLKHLAILSDAVWGSGDLCVLALAELARRGSIGEGEIDAYVDLLPNAAPRADTVPAQVAE